VNRLIAIIILSIFMTGFAMAQEAAQPNDAPGYVMRYADIGGGHIVFTYEDDLWLVPAEGGEARRITSHPGSEINAKFSADGSRLAFTASYDGGNDVYVMDVMGGVPERLTFHPARDLMLDWCPDESGVVFTTRRNYPFRGELYKAFFEGGMPMRLPLDRGSLASVAPDHSGIAYNRIGRHTRTWKRYEGGMAQDIWVKDFASGDITKITDWAGSDNFPMWHEKTIYFTSDREDGTLNIYGYDTGTQQTVRLTEFANYDAKFPSLGDGQIIFQHGPGLKVLDLASGDVREVPITIPSDRRHLRSELVRPQVRTGPFGLSPSGDRVLIETRGEILNLPADEGDPVNLTGAAGSREKNAAWSPDGRWIVFASDRTGEEQLYLVDQFGADEWKQITDGQFGFTTQAVWSPDSKHVIFQDKYLRLNMVDVAGGEAKVIAQSAYDDAWERWGIMDYVWSPDSQWIAYTSQTGNMNEAIWLYDVAKGENHKITDDMTNDWSPSFSTDGEYLYFLSNRTFNPIMGRQDQTHVFLKMAKPYIVLLKDGVRSPFYTDDVTVAAADADADDEDKDKDKDKDEKDEKENGGTVIDLAGIEGRILACEGVEADNYFRLEAVEGGFLMLRKDDPEFLKYQHVDDHTADDLALVKYSLEDKETSDIGGEVANYHLSPDGKKMITRSGTKYTVSGAGKKAPKGEGVVDTGALKVRIDRLQEFEQIFAEAWRIQRDWFYDQNMHGVDWQGMHDKYQPFVAGCGTRGDLNYLIGEMIAELNIGHTYIYGGDFEDRGARVNTGLLGAELKAEEGDDFLKISRIVRGVSWDPRYRSPLAEPGVGVNEGDYLIAIDGAEVSAGDNVYAHLVDKAGRMVTLTVNDKPSAKDARTVRVRTLRREYGVRYREWVDNNLDYVTDKTEGRIGYLHIPNMMDPGLIEFGRSYYPQTGKAAIIIDERYNGGGFVGDQIIDRLERELWGMTAPREGKTGRNPERVHHGPIVILINEDTGSNGEFFAEAIKRMGLAKVIGVRTWGGSIGIEPHQDLVDGAGTTPPQFGLYGLDGTWPIEGWGVEPDIVVVNMPRDVVEGRDTQLDFAIEYLLKELSDNPGQWEIPAVPAYPDKSRPHMSGLR